MKLTLKRISFWILLQRSHYIRTLFLSVDFSNRMAVNKRKILLQPVTTILQPVIKIAEGHNCPAKNSRSLRSVWVPSISFSFFGPSSRHRTWERKERVPSPPLSSSSQRHFASPPGPHGTTTVGIPPLLLFLSPSLLHHHCTGSAPLPPLLSSSPLRKSEVNSWVLTLIVSINLVKNS